MANLTVGNLFKEFNVDSALAYHKLPPGRKPLFLNQLFSSLNTETKRVLEELKPLSGVEGGLKLHFPVKHPTKGEYENLPTDVFLRKTSFYANKVIVTFPFSPIKFIYRKKRLLASDLPSRSIVLGSFSTKRKGVLTEIIPRGNLYYLKKDEFDTYIDLVSSCRDLISFGCVNILPSFDLTGIKSWTFLQDEYGLINADFELENLKKQFFEIHTENAINHNLVVPMIYLPHFTNIPERNVIEVRKIEKNMYAIFQDKLGRKLNSLCQVENEKELLNKLSEIHGGVIGLNEKYDQMLSHFRNKNILALIGFTAVGLIFLLPTEIQLDLLKDLHKIIGSVTPIPWISSIINNKYKKKGLREYDYFLMWKVANIEKGI